MLHAFEYSVPLMVRFLHSLLTIGERNESNGEIGLRIETVTKNSFY